MTHIVLVRPMDGSSSQEHVHGTALLSFKSADVSTQRGSVDIQVLFLPPS